LPIASSNSWKHLIFNTPPKILIMKKILQILTILTLAWGSAIAQDVYYTKSATLKLNGELDGKALQLDTRQLGVMLDYETTEIIIRFPLSSLKSGIDSLDRLIKSSPAEVVFDGSLSLEYINTENHPPLKFTAEGWLTVDKSKKLVTGEGELHHLDDAGQIACMMGMTLPLNLKDLGLRNPVPGLKDDFEAVITQAVLKKDKN
jgi:hypothetical protein